jgi:transcriptional regulator with XRE-family HTH domain
LRFEDRSIRDFAIRVRELRTKRGVSQEKLAEQAGIHRTYLGGIELGLRNPSLRNIARIARALEVPIKELF